MCRTGQLVRFGPDDRSPDLCSCHVDWLQIACIDLSPVRDLLRLPRSERFYLRPSCEKESITRSSRRHQVAENRYLFNSRLFQRDEVSIPGEVRERGGGKQKVSVIDLSQSGFRMHCVFLIPDDRTIFLTMQGLEPMEARIAWHHDDYYGCEFKRRLHQAVYDHIIRTYPILHRKT